MLGSAGTFKAARALSRQREFHGSASFTAARVSRSAGTVAHCTTAQRTTRVNTDTSPVGATGAASDGRTAATGTTAPRNTCAHTQGGTWAMSATSLPDADGACCRWSIHEAGRQTGDKRAINGAELHAVFEFVFESGGPCPGYVICVVSDACLIWHHQCQPHAPTREVALEAWATVLHSAGALVTSW